MAFYFPFDLYRPDTTGIGTCPADSGFGSSLTDSGIGTCSADPGFGSCLADSQD